VGKFNVLPVYYVKNAELLGPGVVMHVCNPSYLGWEAEIRGIRFAASPGKSY
jgi:hypothetical protein